jgi:prepilin signal peptidase PulO-like enzyme (type II secretory pathway)
MNSIILLTAFIYGICIGSFLNVLIWRLPREETIKGRSQCPKCNHQLSWYDLVPVLSYAVQGGQCRYCRAKISPRYAIIEIITGLLFALMLWNSFPLELNNIAAWLVIARVALVTVICIVVFVVDLEHYLILDRVVYPGIALMLTLIIIQSLVANNFGILASGLLAAFLAFAVFWTLWFLSRGRWMGFGDVKFVGFMGLALGLPGIFVALFLSFTIGAVIGLLLIAFGGKEMGSKIPFGTFLSFATVLTMFYGTALWSMYWSLLGL